MTQPKVLLHNNVIGRFLRFAPEYKKHFFSILRDLVNKNFRKSGLNYEKVKDNPPVFSARLNIKARVFFYFSGNNLIILDTDTQHDRVYKKIARNRYLYDFTPKPLSELPFNNLEEENLHISKEIEEEFDNSSNPLPPEQIKLFELPLAELEAHRYAFLNSEIDFYLHLSDEQKSLLYNSDFPLLVSGKAGSGKTTLAIFHAINLARVVKNALIYFFTYNDTLSCVCRYYINNLLGEGENNVHVLSFRDYCRNYLKLNLKKDKVLTPEETLEYIHEITKDSKYSNDSREIYRWLYSLMKGRFVPKEITKILQGKKIISLLDTWDNYNFKHTSPDRVEIHLNTSCGVNDTILKKIKKQLDALEFNINFKELRDFVHNFLSLPDQLPKEEDFHTICRRYGREDFKFEIFRKYQEKLRYRKKLDVSDMIYSAYSRLSKSKIDDDRDTYVIIDELQDFTELEWNSILLLWEKGRKPGNNYPFITGDINQQITFTGYRTNIIKSFFAREYYKGSIKRNLQEKCLTKTFRNSKEIFKLASFINSFSPYRDENTPDEPDLEFEKPLLLIGKEDEFINVLLNFAKDRDYFDVFDKIALIPEDRRHADDFLGKFADTELFILEMNDVKGLEFTDCIIYKMFSTYKPKANHLYNLWYVAVTRARKGLLIFLTEKEFNNLNNIFPGSRETFLEFFNVYRDTSIPDILRSFLSSCDIYSPNYNLIFLNIEKAGRFYRQYLSTGKEEFFTSAVTIWEKNFAYNHLARAYEEKGLFQEGALNFEKAHYYSDAASLYHRGGNFKKAAECYEKVENWYEAALNHELSGDFEKAALLCSKAGKFKKTGEIYESIGDNEKAAFSYEKGEEWFKAAANYEKYGNFTRASELYYRANDFKKSAYCYERTGNIEKAIELYEKIHEYKNAGEIYYKIKEFLKAAFSYEKAGEYKRSADCYRKEEKWYEAAANYEKAGEFYKGAGNYEKAKEPYRAFLLYEKINNLRKMREMEYKLTRLTKKGERLEKSREFLKAGDCYKKAGKFERASLNYERVRKFIRAGEIYEETGNFEKAGECYRRSRKWERASVNYEKAGRVEEACGLYCKAKKFEKAGELYESSGNYVKAAGCYEQSENLLRAVQNYEKAGEFSKAGELYSRMNLFQEGAVCYEKAGDLPKAAFCYEKDCKWKEAAFLYKKTGNLLKGVELFRRADLLSEAGLCYEKMGNFTKAAELYEIVKDFKKSGSCYEKSEEYQKAALCYEKSGNLSRAALNYERCGKTARSADLYVKAEKYQNGAACYLKLKRYREGAECFEKAGKLYEAALYYQKGGKLNKALELYIKEGHFDKASSLCKAAGNMEMSHKYRDMKKEELLKEAENCEKNSSWQKAGVLYEKLKMPDKAAANYEKAENFQKAAVCYERSNIFDKAFQNYEKAEDWTKLGKHYEKLGLPEKAMECYERGNNWTKAGKCYEVKGDLEKALGFYEKSKNFYEAARVCEKMKDFSRAVDYYIKVNGWLEAGKIYEKLGNRGKAQEYYRKAGKKDRKDRNLRG